MDIAPDLKRQGDILSDQAEMLIAEERRDILPVSCLEIINTDDLVPLIQESCAQMRSQKTGATCNNDCLVATRKGTLLTFNNQVFHNNTFPKMQNTQTFKDDRLPNAQKNNNKSAFDFFVRLQRVNLGKLLVNSRPRFCRISVTIVNKSPRYCGLFPVPTSGAQSSVVCLILKHDRVVANRFYPIRLRSRVRW